MKRAVQSIIAACVLASAAPGAAQIINGGFEEGVFGDGSVRQILPGPEALPGWTARGNPLFWYTTGYSLNQIGLTPHSGDFAINLADGSVRLVSVSQTIELLPFQEYQLSFWVGNYAANAGGSGVDASIVDGTSNTIAFSEEFVSPPDQSDIWRHFRLNFITDGTSNTISFSEAIDPQSYPDGVGPTYTGLDDISVVAVPEPSTWALALLGFAGLAMVGMRRRATRLT